MTTATAQKWQRIAARAGKTTTPLSATELEIFKTLTLDRRTDRKAGKPVNPPAMLHHIARTI